MVRMRALIVGGGHGVGAAVARRLARVHGSDAVVALAGRSTAHPTTGETLRDAARAVDAHGACALAYDVDPHRAADVVRATTAALEVMGGLDVLVHCGVDVQQPHPAPRSSSARQIDRLFACHARTCLLTTQHCRDALDAARGAIVTLAPPVRLGRTDWLAAHPAYTVAMYATTLAALAAATPRVRSNCIWPRYAVVDNGGRAPDDVASAVVALAHRDAAWNAATLYDDDVVDLPVCVAPLDAFGLDRRPTPDHA